MEFPILKLVLPQLGVPEGLDAPMLRVGQCLVQGSELSEFAVLEHGDLKHARWQIVGEGTQGEALPVPPTAGPAAGELPLFLPARLSRHVPWALSGQGEQWDLPLNTTPELSSRLLTAQEV